MKTVSSTLSAGRRYDHQRRRERSPREIEEVLHDLEGVNEVAVVRNADDQWGERVKADIILKDGNALTADGIVKHVKANSAESKEPPEVEFRDELPQTRSEKS